MYVQFNGTPHANSTVVNQPEEQAGNPLGMEDGADGVGEEQAGNPGFALRRRRGKITPEDAVTIYLAQDRRTPKTASLLAVQYGITSKAVRDIWCEQTSSTQVAAAVQPQQTSVGQESVGHACETRSR